MSRHTILTSFSNVTIGIISALYGLLILRFFANRPIEMDAFFLAYALLTALMMFSATLRISVVPMIADGSRTEEEAVGRYGEIAIAVGACFLVATLLAATLSAPLGRALGYGLCPEGRRLTGLVLLAFAPVIFLQGMAHFLGAALGARGGFDFVSVSASAASIAGLLIFVLTAFIGIFSVVLGLFTFNLVFAGSQWLHARSIGMVVHGEDWRRISASRLFQTIGTIFSCSSVYIAFNLAYIISQSLSTTLSTGTPTAFAYAYTITALAITATSASMGITLTVRYRDYARGPTGPFRDYVLEHAAMAGLIASGVLGLLSALALPLGSFIFAILPSGEISTELGSERAVLFARAMWSLAITGWGIGIFAVLAPATVAARRNRQFTGFALLALAVHFLVSVVLKRTLGLVGLGISFSLSAFLFTTFQTMQLHLLFGRGFVKPMARRLFTSAGTGAAASACSVLASQAVQSVAGWLLALPVAVLLFGALYCAGTLLYERNSWASLFSHFKRKDT